MNKLNKSLSLILVLLTVSFISTSCNDFLEEHDKTHPSEESYFSSNDEARAFVDNMYADIRFITDGTGTYGESPFEMLEFPTGILDTENGQAKYNKDLRDLKANADNNYLKEWWENSYEAIGNTNLAIDRIPEIEGTDEEELNDMLAEAKFMRAFHYFNLVRMFGEIPLSLEPVTLDSDSLYLERSPIADVYDAIVSDLQDAEESNLPSTDEDGRASKGAVKALLADVYLTMAGYPLRAGDDYYKKAADKAKEVIDEGGYELFDKYDKLHDPAFANSEEIIFQSNYKASDDVVSGITNYHLSKSNDFSQYSSPNGSVIPREDFVESYEEGDRRVKQKGFYIYHYIDTDNPMDTIQFPQPYIYKHFDVDAVENTAQSDLGWTFIRYAQVLLTYAEAGFKADGPTDDVLNAVNQVRERAGLSDFNSNISEEDIWTERLHEMAYEMKYWFDIVRRREAFDINTGKWEDAVGHEFTYGPTFSEKDLLFGIPQTAIDNNKKLEPNNEGW